MKIYLSPCCMGATKAKLWYKTAISHGGLFYKGNMRLRPSGNPVTLRWVSGENEGARHRGSLPPIATWWQYPTSVASSTPRGSLDAGHSMEVITGWHRGGPLEGLQRLDSPETALLSHDPPLSLLTLYFTGSGIQQPTWCLHSASSRGTELASSLVPMGG